MSRKTRPIRIEGDVAYITLTKGYEAVIDAADVPLVEGYVWHAIPRKHTVYAQHTTPLPNRKAVLLHRLIMGEPAGMNVDHRDGDGLNNRRRGEAGNLRIATVSQNRHNTRLLDRNTSGFKGVTWDKSRGKWKAMICLNDKRVNLGRFDDLEAAHAAYVAASQSLHGEFGRTA